MQEREMRMVKEDARKELIIVFVTKLLFVTDWELNWLFVFSLRALVLHLEQGSLISNHQ